jgi:hypothetical protein
VSVGKVPGGRKTRDWCCIVDSVVFSCLIEGGLEQALDRHQDHMHAEMEPVNALLGRWIESRRESQEAQIDRHRGAAAGCCISSKTHLFADLLSGTIDY